MRTDPRPDQDDRDPCADGHDLVVGAFALRCARLGCAHTEEKR